MKEVRSHGHICLCSFLHAHYIVQAACVSSPWGLGLSRAWLAQAASSLHTVEQGQRHHALDACFTPPPGRNVAASPHGYEFNVLTTSMCFRGKYHHPDPKAYFQVDEFSTTFPKPSLWISFSSVFSTSSSGFPSIQDEVALPSM